MGVTCPVCGTENRSVAKFCIECIGSLPTVFAATEILPHLPSIAHRSALVGVTGDPGETSALRRSEFVTGGSAAAVSADSASSATSAISAPIANPARSAAFINASTTPTAQPQQIPSGPRRHAEGRKGLWVSVAAFAIALVIGAAGWLVAGAGGLYIYAFGHAGANGAPEAAVASAAPVATAVLPAQERAQGPAQAAAMAVPVVSVALAPGASAVPVGSTATTFVSPTPIGPPSSPTQLFDAAQPMAKNVAGPRSTSTSTSTSPSSSPAAPSVATRTAAASRSATKPPAEAHVPPRTPAPVRTALANDPNTQCTGLGFFAASRCIASQCAKTDYAAHPACAAVRQQQRLMEEKRNPTMAN